MPQRRINNPLALAVLSCLNERPMHPYEISATLRHRSKEDSIRLNYGSLYSVVDALQKHELIAPRETTRNGRRPERTIYEITPAGVAEFEDWLAELLSTPVREYTSLEAGLSLMPGLPPDDVVALLRKRAERLRIELRTLDSTFAEAADMQLPELFQVETRYRQALLQAELGFVCTLADRIAGGEAGGVATWRRIHELRNEGIGFAEILTDPERWLGEEGRLLRPPS